MFRNIYRPWAYWRRVQYGAGVGVVFLLLVILLYFKFFYATPTCFDGRQNGGESGIDCGGACTRICALGVIPPVVQWAQAFRVTEGQYNAVAYVENRNKGVGTSALSYTFTLYNDKGSVITTRSGKTSLPPDGVYPIFEGRIAVGKEIPARTFLELVSVDNWQGATAGRAQFEVRSRALVSADSKPRLNTAIYNTSLEEVQNMEIVATIFDVSGKALTASQSVIPRFAGREEQQVVFTWPEPIATTLRSCEVPTDVMLAIDLSGSMNNDGGTPPEPISSALKAAESFVDLLGKGEQAGVVSYATKANLNQGLAVAHTVTQNVIRTLNVDPKEERGETNIGDAIAVAQNEFLTPRHNQNARKVLVLLTDGKATGPGNEPEVYAERAAQAARSAGITLFIIGLGKEVNDAFLTSVAFDKTRYYTAPNVANLGAIYRSISTALCEEGAAVIDVVPKTPVR